MTRDLPKPTGDGYWSCDGRIYGKKFNKIEHLELTRVPLPDHPFLKQVGATPKQLLLLERHSS